LFKIGQKPGTVLEELNTFMIVPRSIPPEMKKVSGKV
jgi:hypothetical protein